MRYKLIAIGLLVVLLLSTAGCSGGNVAVEFSCDDFAENNHITHDVSTAVGSEIVITLCSNPSTGFGWQEVQISDASALKLVDREFLASGTPGNPAATGAPGKEILTFKATQPGTSVAKIEYSRPWEGGEKGVWTYTLTVSAK
jgi:predicted secreted protein